MRIRKISDWKSDFHKKILVGTVQFRNAPIFQILLLSWGEVTQNEAVLLHNFL